MSQVAPVDGMHISEEMEEIEEKLTTKCASYLVFDSVDNSSVAENRQQHWQQVVDDHQKQRNGLLCRIAAVCAPRYTHSIDDVSRVDAHCRHKGRHDDPS